MLLLINEKQFLFRLKYYCYMDNGQLRFENQLTIIEQLIDESRNKEDRGLWLLENNLRTSLFMIEGLARLYRKCHNKKLFKKIGKKAKKIEDQLGQIDYLKEVYSSFSENANIPSSIKVYLVQNINDETKKLNTLLEDKGWLDYSQVKKIKKRLREEICTIYRRGNAFAKYANERNGKCF